MRDKKRGQISAEMIIILAVLLGLVLVVATRLQETAKGASSKVENQSSQVFSEIDQTAGIAKKSSGAPCTTDDQCRSNYCDSGTCT